MLLHTWLPATLRSAGLKVVETSGWTGRSHGQLPATVKVVWHHDASPPGDSPGALNWMISNWNNASAQIWVDNYGTWHLVGTGVAWHAGTVKSGMPGNMDSIGIETDQTTGEAWPPAQLDSLRKGTAAIFKKQGVDTGWLHFHKTICSPTGRKSDPTGLELGPERRTVGKLMTGGTVPPANTPKPPTTAAPPTPPKDANDMADITDKQMDQIAKKVVDLMWARTVRANDIDPVTGKATAKDRPYGETVGGTYTSAGTAAYRASVNYPPK